MALALKLLEDLKESGVGTNEIEADAKKREVQRSIKIGKCVEGIQIDSEKCTNRDERYIKGLLKLRADQVREDWKKLKVSLEKKRKEIKESCKTEKDRNKCKRMFDRVKKKSNELYTKGRSKHEEKKRFLEKKYKNKKDPRKMKDDKRKKRLNRIAQGKQIDVENTVPMYGEVPQLSDQAKEVLLHPIKHKLMDKVTVKGMQFESTLCSTKTQYGRMTMGNLEEQAQDLELALEVGLPTEEEYYREQVLQNQCRETYDPETKSLDMGKLKGTDLKDNPRLLTKTEATERGESPTG